MKKSIIIILMLAASLAFAQEEAAPQKIAPPEWIWGKWYMEFNGELLELIFREDDILMNGESMQAMIDGGYITAYEQALDTEAYSISAQYADGFWWAERFPRPTMTSAYTDKSYSGGAEELYYVKGEGLSPKQTGQGMQLPPAEKSAPAKPGSGGNSLKPPETGPITPNSMIP